MKRENQISGLIQTGNVVRNFLAENTPNVEWLYILKRSEVENPWFTEESQRFALEQWADLLDEKQLHKWLESYTPASEPKKIGLILAGNLPLVGFHDVISVILSGHIPVIKLSSKDRLWIPHLLKLWQTFTPELGFELVEKLDDFDAVIATGSNNTARYLEYYFSKKPNIIRKNRTSVAVLSGEETNEEMERLGKDIFTYFGLGCRNVTRLFIPEEFPLERIFENLIPFQDVINHNKYANNYDYNRAVYLLNQEKFWDNNFVLLRESDDLFSPLSVVNFSRYKTIEEVDDFLKTRENEIQAVVSNLKLSLPYVGFGESQKPAINTYADNVDTMKFLETL